LKGKHLFATIFSILISLTWLVTGCSQAPAATPTASTTPPKTSTTTPPASAPVTVTQETKFNALDPRGIEQPVQIVSMAKRLDTLDGKTIYVNQGEADPVIMPALYKIVQDKYPKTTWKYIGVSGFGPAALEDEVKTTAKAVLRGISW
jgi:hypothetical protein